MSAKLFTVNNKGDHAEILITGPIGGSFWDDSGMTEKAFLDALKEIPEDKPLTIGINSEGGSIQDGLGIFNAIKRRKNTTARIDGYAVSIASVIPLAAQRVISPKSSIWMIHEPWMMAAGNAEDMLKAAEVLEKHGETLAQIYQEETGMSADEVRKKMKAETWFRGDEAVSMGFADESSEAQAAFNKLDPQRFKNCPPEFLKIISAADRGTNQTKPDSGHSPEPQPPLSAPIVSAAVVPPTQPAAHTAPQKEPHMSEPIAPAAADKSAEILAKLDGLQNEINALKTPPPGAPPMAAAPKIEIGDSVARKSINAHTEGKARMTFLRDNWNNLAKAGIPLSPIYNANTTDAALTTDMLKSGLIVVLQNRLAPLTAFTRDFGTDPLKPKAIVQVPIATAGGTAQVNATSFEDTTNFVGTVDNVAITVNRITSGSHLTAAELNSGFRMAQFAEIKAHELADKIQAAVNAVITTGNFTATPIAAAEEAFGPTDLRDMWAAVVKSSMKNIMLSAQAFKNFIPANLESFNPLATGNYPGWDGFYLNTYWTGATTDTYGFACNPQAIAVASGLPLASPNRGMTTQAETLALPGIGLTVELQQWYATAGKVDWANWEVMFGAAKGDGSAGILAIG